MTIAVYYEIRQGHETDVRSCGNVRPIIPVQMRCTVIV